jgi:hypothetical protein
LSGKCFGWCESDEQLERPRHYKANESEEKPTDKTSRKATMSKPKSSETAKRKRRPAQAEEPPAPSTPVNVYDWDSDDESDVSSCNFDGDAEPLVLDYLPSIPDLDSENEEDQEISEKFKEGRTPEDILEKATDPFKLLEVSSLLDEWTSDSEDEYSVSLHEEETCIVTNAVCDSFTVPRFVGTKTTWDEMTCGSDFEDGDKLDDDTNSPANKYCLEDWPSDSEDEYSVRPREEYAPPDAKNDINDSRIPKCIGADTAWDELDYDSEAENEDVEEDWSSESEDECSISLHEEECYQVAATD